MATFPVILDESNFSDLNPTNIEENVPVFSDIQVPANPFPPAPISTPPLTIPVFSDIQVPANPTPSPVAPEPILAPVVSFTPRPPFLEPLIPEPAPFVPEQAPFPVPVPRFTTTTTTAAPLEPLNLFLGTPNEPNPEIKENISVFEEEIKTGSLKKTKTLEKAKITVTGVIEKLGIYGERTRNFSKMLISTEAWIIVGIVFILFILTVFLAIRGINSNWFQQLEPYYNWGPIIVLWVFCYLILVLGVFLMFMDCQKYNNEGTILLFACLMGFGILLGLAWVSLLLYYKNVYTAFVVQVMTLLYYLLFFYIMFSYGKLYCIFMAPLLVLTSYILLSGTTSLFAKH